MIDAHVHLEKGEYTVEWIEQFIDAAIKREIDEIFFLEHTHIFKECAPLYDEMSAYNEYQKNWYQKKWEQARPIGEYIDYIEKIKRLDFPIRLKFGLEVCYSPEHESDIAKIKQLYSFDFVTGSIHFIDGWAFSHLRQRWEKKDYDIDKLYERYYALMLSLINSGLFSGVAHPQSLQCYGAYPQKDYRHIYLQLAQALCENGMYIEENSGLAINYGDRRLGMNLDMLECMVKCGVPVYTASDAHLPANVGLYIKEMEGLIRSAEVRAGGVQRSGALRDCHISDKL